MQSGNFFSLYWDTTEKIAKVWVTYIFSVFCFLLTQNVQNKILTHTKYGGKIGNQENLFDSSHSILFISLFCHTQNWIFLETRINYVIQFLVRWTLFRCDNNLCKFTFVFCIIEFSLKDFPLFSRMRVTFSLLDSLAIGHPFSISIKKISLSCDIIHGQTDFSLVLKGMSECQLVRDLY